MKCILKLRQRLAPGLTCILSCVNKAGVLKAVLMHRTASAAGEYDLRLQPVCRVLRSAGLDVVGEFSEDFFPNSIMGRR